jgi:hypothetical protein
MRAALLIAVLGTCSPQLHAASKWRDGDVIFQTSRSAQSIAIQRATHSSLDEPVVSPARLFGSPLLTEVMTQ